MRTLLLLIVVIVIILTTSCQRRQPTDIDYLGQGYNGHGNFSFQSDCKIPKELRGLGKYKINCLISEKDDAWIRSINGPHGREDFLSRLGDAGYRHIGSTNVPGEHLDPGSWDHAIQVLEKPTRRDNCFRRIYIDARDILQSTSNELPKGTQIIIADPWALYCRKDETK